MESKRTIWEWIKWVAVGWIIERGYQRGCQDTAEGFHCVCSWIVDYIDSGKIDAAREMAMDNAGHLASAEYPRVEIKNPLKPWTPPPPPSEADMLLEYGPSHHGKLADSADRLTIGEACDLARANRKRVDDLMEREVDRNATDSAEPTSEDGK